MAQPLFLPGKLPSQVQTNKSHQVDNQKGGLQKASCPGFILSLKVYLSKYNIFDKFKILTRALGTGNSIIPSIWMTTISLWRGGFIGMESVRGEGGNNRGHSKTYWANFIKCFVIKSLTICGCQNPRWEMEAAFNTCKQVNAPLVIYYFF